MNEARADFQESVTEHKVNIDHFVPAAARRMTEKDYAARSGPCKVVSLPNLPTMAARIRYCMQEKTQEEFSQRLGVNRLTVSRWCHGKNDPSKSMLKLISKSTGFPYQWILNGTTEAPTEQQPVEEVHAEEKPVENQETEHAEKTRSPAFRLTLDGTYSGEALAHLISGLLPDQKYKVNINVEA